MKRLISVFSRFRLSYIPTNRFDATSNVATISEKSCEVQETLPFEDAARSAITGIYMFRAQANSLLEKKRKDAYCSTVNMLSSTLKQFDNVTSGQENAMMHIGLLSSSINNSLSRLAELLDTFANERIDQKKESTAAALAEAERIRDTLYQQYIVKKSDDQLSKDVEEKLEDLGKTITTLQKSLQSL